MQRPGMHDISHKWIVLFARADWLARRWLAKYSVHLRAAEEKQDGIPFRHGYLEEIISRGKSVVGTRKQSIRARKNSSKKFPSLLFFVEFFLARFDYFRVPTISICPWVSKDDTLVPGFRIHTFSGYCTVVLHQCPFASVCLHTRDVYRLIPTIFVLRAVRSVGRGTGLPCWRSWVQTPAGPTPRVFKYLSRKCCLCNDICKWLDFLVFSYKDDKP